LKPAEVATGRLFDLARCAARKPGAKRSADNVHYQDLENAGAGSLGALMAEEKKNAAAEAETVFPQFNPLLRIVPKVSQNLVEAKSP
jgi:hypothetical protein